MASLRLLTRSCPALYLSVCLFQLPSAYPPLRGTWKVRPFTQGFVHNSTPFFSVELYFWISGALKSISSVLSSCWKTQISRVKILFIRFAPEKQTVGANAQEKQLQVKQSWGLRRVYAVGRPQWPINWLCLPRVGRLPWLRASPADKVRPSAGGLGPNLPRFPIYTHSHRSPGFKRKYWNIKETKKHR